MLRVLGVDGEAARAYRPLAAHGTGDVRYEEVPRLKGYPIDAYRNPLRREDGVPRRWEPPGFFGAAAPPPGAVERSTETLDHNTAAFSSSLPFEDLPTTPLDSLAEVEWL